MILLWSRINIRVELLAIAQGVQEIGFGLLAIVHALNLKALSFLLNAQHNGFGIVSNSNVIPASRERVERLMDSLESTRDQAIEQLLTLLAVHEEWRTTEQGRFFAATLFPTPAVCYQLAIRQHIWDEYQKQHARFIKIENVFAETYFFQEQMTVFRTKVLDRLQDCHPFEERVIRSLQPTR